MNARPLLRIGDAALLVTLSGAAVAKEPHMPFVRMAELRHDHLAQAHRHRACPAEREEEVKGLGAWSAE